MFETAILASDFDCAQCCQFCWSNLKLVRFLVRLFCFFFANPFCVFLYSFEVPSDALFNAGPKVRFSIVLVILCRCVCVKFVVPLVLCIRVVRNCSFCIFRSDVFMMFNYCFYSVLRYFVMQRVAMPILAFIVFENIQSLLSRS